MPQLQMLILTGLAGPAYLLLLCLAGATLGQGWLQAYSCRWERAAVALIIGLLAHALLASVLLVLAPAWTALSAGMLLAGCAIRWFWCRPQIAPLVVPVLLVAGYSLACYVLLVSFHHSPARGDTLFWSIYNLTNITPGDSPQAAFQAQYLVHQGQLLAGESFALFDRPFLGGIITAATLPALGLSLSERFYDYSTTLALAYSSLWMAINAIVVLPLLHIIHRYSQGRTAHVISVLLLASPFLVFNTIGLWPKLLGLALLCLACTQALRQRWGIAALLSGIAFFAHGSFLWSHIALCGVMFFALAVEGWRARQLPWAAVSIVLAMTVAVPAIWFIAEDVYGGATPLRTYYLYNVDVAYGLHHSAEKIAAEFYASTNATNLAVLPWMNLAKGVLPIEMLDLVLNFKLTDQATGWRALGESLFRNQFMRIWFALGLIGGVITLRGLFSAQSSRWLPRLALVAFFLLPLIPGLGLYRRDDHFLLPVMLFAAIPVLISFCIGLRSLRPMTITLVALAMLAEYLMIYYWRYPPGRFVGEFHAHYLVVVAVAMAALVWLVCRRHRHGGVQHNAAMEPAQ